MRRQMHRMWWKITGALLVFYTLIVGLILPVGPGIKSVFPDRQTVTSAITLHVTGYNSHFATGGDETKVWLKRDKYYICPTRITVINNDHLEADFQIPEDLPTAYAGRVFDVVANTDNDGTFILRNAFTVTGPSHSGVDGDANTPCEPQVSANHPSYLSFPYRIVLYETIRNLFFHVPMWFVMTILLLCSVIYSIRHLRKFNAEDDIFASQFAFVAILFGLLGFATGSLWGNFAWGNLGTWLTRDTRVLGAMIGLLIYLAYFILRSSIDSQEKRARISAVYNIFSFTMFVVFIYIMPRMTETLHPGAGGNPAFDIYDVDNTMRWVFYPAVLGWILIGCWLVSQRVRMKFIQQHNMNLN